LAREIGSEDRKPINLLCKLRQEEGGWVLPLRAGRRYAEKNRSEEQFSLDQSRRAAGWAYRTLRVIASLRVKKTIF
jgi:hypothetical protein